MFNRFYAVQIAYSQADQGMRQPTDLLLADRTANTCEKIGNSIALLRNGLQTPII